MKPPLGEAMMGDVLDDSGEQGRHNTIIQSHVLLTSRNMLLGGLDILRLLHPQPRGGRRATMHNHHVAFPYYRDLPKYHEATITPRSSTLVLTSNSTLNLRVDHGFVGSRRGRSLQRPLEAKSVGAQKARGYGHSRGQKATPSHPQMHSPQWREIPGRFH